MIPIQALEREALHLENALDKIARDVIDSGRYCYGDYYYKFCSEFSKYCGTNHCIGVANGTDAIELALRAVGVEPGDEVITVANAGAYSTIAIRSIGATPVFIDVNSTDYLMDTSLVENAINPKTKAIVATHLYGSPVDMTSLIEHARNFGLYVVEDCAQSHGLQYGAKKVGTIGHVAAFSFYPTKNLGALGDGGAVLTSDQELASKVKSLAQYGWSNTRY